MIKPWMTHLLPVSRRITFVAGIALTFLALQTVAPQLAAQGDQASAPDATEQTDPLAGNTAIESVEVDWLEQIRAGGFTMLALGIVSIAGLAFTVERALTIRRKYFCPPGLADVAVRLIESGDFHGLLALAKRYPSTLGRILTFLVEHRTNDYTKLTATAENLGARDIIDQEERIFPLAVVASIAPLLGLLGTMIGMIEAFQLVSIYGDDGGASMLAGSIAKALITTAAGLILAIPAICAFHYFKHKLHKIGVQLDKDVERILTSSFLVKASPDIASEAAATEHVSADMSPSLH